MKKVILSLTLSAVFFSSAFAFGAAGDPGSKVKQAFTNEFSHVKDVEWTAVNNDGLYQAKFIFNNEALAAFFTEDGIFLGTTRQIIKSQLPVIVANELEKQYTGADLVSIYEYSKKDGLCYFITLTDKNGSMIVKATANGDLSVYKKNLK